MSKSAYFESNRGWSLRCPVWEAAAKLAAYEDAEQQGTLSMQRFASGTRVYVIEWDENGEAINISDYMFIAQVGGYAIVSPYIGDNESIISTMEYHKENTATNYCCELAVFPIHYCRENRADAEKQARIRGEEST